MPAGKRHWTPVPSDLPPRGLKLTGEGAHWDMVADSGDLKTRFFCPTCGSPVYLTFSAMPEFFAVRAASLDDPSRYRPQVLTYAARGYAWDHVDPMLTRFDGMPPSAG